MKKSNIRFVMNLLPQNVKIGDVTMPDNKNSVEDEFIEQIEPQMKEIIEHLKKLSTYQIHHDYTFANEDYVKSSNKCGCFHCGKIFDASEVEEEKYIKEKNGKRTAICPYCGIDSVIPDSKVELTSELIQLMNDEWFGGSMKKNEEN